MTDDVGDPDRPLVVPDLWSVKYQYSYGRSSRFFRELKDNRRLMGTRCPKCGRVLCAPRADCRTCYVPTEWVEVARTGTVLTYAVVHEAVSDYRGPTPYAVAQVNIDGTDSCILQIVRGIEPDKVRVGLRVQARFKAEREGRITDIECFEPAPDAPGEQEAQ